MAKASDDLDFLILEVFSNLSDSVGNRTVTADLGWFKMLWTCCFNRLAVSVNLSSLSESMGVR